jgi:hypothetical protein
MRSTWTRLITRSIRRHPAFPVLAVVGLLVGAGGSVAFGTDTPSPAPPSPSPASNEELLKELKAMRERIQVLEGQLQQQRMPATPAPPSATPAPPAGRPSVATAPTLTNTTSPQPMVQGDPTSVPPVTGDRNIFGLMPSPLDGLRLGAYGEFKFGSRQNPDNNGRWQSGFDAHRLVLLPTYQLTDRIIFNAEIEFEHAGSGFDADDKLHGTAEIEQAWVDFLISPHFNIRSPGIDLVPVGYINQRHEPTLFYSVNRPELASGLVPTTWAAPSTSVYGKIVDNLYYQFQISSSLEDFGDDFDKRTDGGTVPAFPAGYAAGITGREALNLARPPRGDFRQLSNDLAYTWRLSYTPPFIPGFAGSTSVYFTPNTTPRGAYADTGARLGRSSLTMLDTEFRYRIPTTGFEFRGEYVQIFFGNPANLRANNDSDPTNNVGRTMYGLSGEAAYHLLLGQALGADWELVPFYRYTYEDRQTGGFRGTDENQPLGFGKLQFHTLGAALFPGSKLVLKLNYQKVLDRERGGAKSDSILGGVGFYFQ